MRSIKYFCHASRNAKDSWPKDWLIPIHNIMQAATSLTPHCTFFLFCLFFIHSKGLRRWNLVFWFLKGFLDFPSPPLLSEIGAKNVIFPNFLFWVFSLDSTDHQITTPTFALILTNFSHIHILWGCLVISVFVLFCYLVKFIKSLLEFSTLQ